MRASGNRTALPEAGVWTFFAELTAGSQPGGLAEGSRWSLRAKGKRPPEDRVGWSCTPAGCQTSWPPDAQSSEQIPGVVLDAVSFQKFPELLFKGLLAVMRLLCGDRFPPRLRPAGTDCEYRVTLLPFCPDNPAAFFRGADPVVMQAVIGGTHCRRGSSQFSGARPIASSVAGDASGTPPGCGNLEHAFRWSPPPFPVRPPATLCQPSGLASVMVGRMSELQSPALPEDSPSLTVPGMLGRLGIRRGPFPPHPCPLPRGKGELQPVGGRIERYELAPNAVDYWRR